MDTMSQEMKKSSSLIFFILIFTQFHITILLYVYFITIYGKITDICANIININENNCEVIEKYQYLHNN